MPLNRFVGQEPIGTINIREDPRNDELKRVSIDPAYNVITWLGPEVNEIWDIEAAQIELNTSANVGTRDVYLYIMDEHSNTLRFEAFSSAAAFNNTYVGIPGANWGGTMISATHKTLLGPCYVHSLKYPCRIGVLKTTFDGGDIIHFHLLVRERRYI